MPSCYTILVGCRHFSVGSNLSAIASARELHPGVKPSRAELVIFYSGSTEYGLGNNPGKSIGRPCCLHAFPAFRHLVSSLQMSFVYSVKVYQLRSDILLSSVMVLTRSDPLYQPCR